MAKRISKTQVVCHGCQKRYYFFISLRDVGLKSSVKSRNNSVSIASIYQHSTSLRNYRYQTFSHYLHNLLPVEDGLADGKVPLDGHGQGHVDGGAEGHGGERVEYVDVHVGEVLWGIR